MWHRFAIHRLFTFFMLILNIHIPLETIHWMKIEDRHLWGTMSQALLRILKKGVKDPNPFFCYCRNKWKGLAHGVLEVSPLHFGPWVNILLFDWIWYPGRISTSWNNYLLERCVGKYLCLVAIENFYFFVDF